MDQNIFQAKYPFPPPSYQTNTEIIWTKSVSSIGHTSLMTVNIWIFVESCSDRLLAGEVAASLITQLPAAPWNQPDPSLAVNPVSKPSHLRYLEIYTY